VKGKVLCVDPGTGWPAKKSKILFIWETMREIKTPVKQGSFQTKKNFFPGASLLWALGAARTNETGKKSTAANRWRRFLQGTPLF